MRMANGQDTSPHTRLQLAAALRDGQRQLVPRRTNKERGRRHNPIADFMIAVAVYKELQGAYCNRGHQLADGKRGQLAEAYRAVEKRFGKSPKRIEQIWLKIPAAKLFDKDPAKLFDKDATPCLCAQLALRVAQCCRELNRKSNPH